MAGGTSLFLRLQPYRNPPSATLQNCTKTPIILVAQLQSRYCSQTVTYSSRSPQWLWFMSECLYSVGIAGTSALFPDQWRTSRFRDRDEFNRGTLHLTGLRPTAATSPCGEDNNKHGRDENKLWEKNIFFLIKSVTELFVHSLSFSLGPLTK